MLWTFPLTSNNVCPEVSFGDIHSVVEAGICRRNLSFDIDEEAANQAVQKIFDIARTSQRQPFFLTVSFTHPHEPFSKIYPNRWVMILSVAFIFLDATQYAV